MRSDLLSACWRRFKHRFLCEFNSFKASKSSSGKAVLEVPRKIPKVLLSRSQAIRKLSPERGPMQPKTGNIRKVRIEWTTTCSAISIFPAPVAPSMTTTPPSLKGLPFGGFEAMEGSAGIGKALSLWISLRKPLPKSSDALEIPCHDLMLQSRMTPSCSSALDKPPDETPPKAF